jgi:hypothetical protein
MWAEYKKHLVGMQVMILLVTFAAYQFSHLWFVASVFFATMQAGSFLGAAWAHRIRNRLQQQQW